MVQTQSNNVPLLNSGIPCRTLIGTTGQIPPTYPNWIQKTDNRIKVEMQEEGVNVLKIESIKAASSGDPSSQSGTREAKLDIIFLAYNNCENTTITTAYRVTSTEPVS